MKTRQYAAITGDIVGSSHLRKGEREKLLTYLKTIFDEIKEKWGGELEQEFDMSRGDSFQALLNNPISALRIVLFIRLKLLADEERKYPESWDARIAIGIGALDFKGNEVATSDGRAFRNSGPVLDKMKGKERIRIKSDDDEFNAEMKVASLFLDAVAARWTDGQALVMLEKLEKLDKVTQKEIAKALNMKYQSTVSRMLSDAHWEAVEELIKRYESLTARLDKETE
ncbi:MAG: SatD family protein [Bacteroidia bacterium]|nr:SatD family protein [Bacteroidia bacterium]